MSNDTVIALIDDEQPLLFLSELIAQVDALLRSVSGDDRDIFLKYGDELKEFKGYVRIWGDWEWAIYISVLKAIAGGEDEPEEWARQALRVREAKFPRWSY